MKPRRWIDKEIITLNKLYNEKVPISEIAKKLDRTLSSCYTMLHDCRCHVDSLSKKIDEEAYQRERRKYEYWKATSNLKYKKKIDKNVWIKDIKHDFNGR